MKHNWSYKKLNEVCEKASSNIALNKIENNIGKYPLYGASGLVKHIDFYHKDKPYIGIIKDGAGVGRVGRYPAYSSLVGTMQYIHPNEEICQIDYLYYALQSLHLNESETGATIPHIYFKDYGNLPIPIPSLLEQQAIVSELDGIHRLIDLQEQQLCEYDRLAQAVYFNMFGDVRRNHHSYNIVSLSEAFSLITDGTHQTPTYTEDKINGYKFLSAKDVISGVIDWSHIKYIPLDLHEVLYKRLAPRRNDLLLCKNGTTGVCALVDTDEVFDIYVSLALLRPKDDIMPLYLVYAINNPATKEQFNSSLKGIGVPNLHLSEIKKAKIILPPLALQQSFAAQIEAIEQQKALVRKSLEETRTLLAARMQYYFE